MSNRYVNVTITRQTQAVSQKGFGLPLIFTTDKALAYTEYTDVADIGTEFGTTSKTYDLAVAIMGQTPKVEKVAVYGIGTYVAGTDPASELSAALNELVKTNNDFYYLTCTEQDDAEIQELNTWVSTQEKLYFASTANQSLASVAGERTAILVHPKPETYPSEAWAGVGAPQVPGGFTWAFKTLNNIEPSGYSTTEIGTIEGANFNTYIKEGGVNITSQGKTASGEYIDIMQGQDYIKARMTENVYGLLVRTPKVPFTDGGIAQVVAEVEKSLVDAANKGIIATDADGQPLFSVTAPNAADVSATDKGNRVLPDVNWSATLSGAVESVNINGSLQL